MDNRLGSEIVIGFLEEVEGYLPDMRRCLQILKQEREDRQALAELHRITHTIKGAAAMVGLDDLSGIGGLLEKVMEHILASSLLLDDELLYLLGEATQRIDTFCTMQRLGESDDGSLYQETLAALQARLSGLPAEAEEDMTERILVENLSELQIEPGIEQEEGEQVVVDVSQKDDNDSMAGLLGQLLSNKVAGADESEGGGEENDDLFSDFGDAGDDKALLLDETADKSLNQEQNNKDLFEIEPDLLQCFNYEAEEQLESIDSQLNTLSSFVTESLDGQVELIDSTRETLHSIRRSVHTLKGAAAVIGVEQIAAWGHDFEDFLDWLYDESPVLSSESVDVMQDGTDLLAKLAEEPDCVVGAEKQILTGRIARIIAATTDATDDAEAGRTENELKEASKELDPDEFLGAEQPVLTQSTHSESSVSSDTASVDTMADFFAEVDLEEQADDTLETLFDQSPSAAVESLSTEEHLFSSLETDVTDEVAETKFQPEVLEDSIHGIVQEALEVDPELLECFHEEAEEHLENIDTKLNHFLAVITGVVELSAAERDALHSIRRSVHTLKGAAAVIGIESIAAWGHDFEDFLDWLHDDSSVLSPEIVEAMLDGTDLLVNLAEDPACPIDQQKALVISQFTKIIEKSTSGSSEQSPSDGGAVSSDAFKEESSSSIEPLSPPDAMADLFGEEAQDTDSAESFFDELAVSPDDASDSAADDLFDFSESNEAESQEAGIPAEQGAIDPELLECFHEEAKDHLENIDKKINYFSSIITSQVELSASNRDTLHSLRRSVHTLKGAAAVIGVEQVAAWGHDFEDFLDWVHDEGEILNPEIVAVMLEAADVLVRRVDDPCSSVKNEEQGVTDGFNRIIAEKNTAPASFQSESVERKKSVPDTASLETAIPKVSTAEVENNLSLFADKTEKQEFPSIPIRKKKPNS
ncbi:MAG: hypothetical protein D3924_01025, partial [Candidatus Electrothrix sp. AR4]|nr:hypothetical protein [Candidatus Electrothrix sp. AR4]